MKHNSFIHRCLSGLLLVAGVVLPSRSASAAQVYELPSVLVIAKSSNRNQVHYAALIDGTCTPAGPSPVRPYWHMFERGPLVTEPLLNREQRLLGLERETVAGDDIQFALRGMPARTFTVHLGRAADGRCASWVGTTIAGVPARVDSVYVKQKLFSVEYVLLTGWSLEGTLVRERVSP
jgi:hypothetical protein